MAMQTRRYQYEGPWPLDMQLATDPGVPFPSPTFVIAFDATFDDAVADVEAVDERMTHYGCFPEPVDTQTLSATPYVGLISPDGSIWKVSVNDAGVISTTKVTP